MMNLIWKNTLVYLKRKQMLMVVFILPMVSVLLLGGLFSNMILAKRTVDPMEVIIVDQEQSMFSKMLIRHFENTESFSKLVHVISATEKEANTIYEEGRITGIITIPEDFSASLLYLENHPIQVRVNPQHLMKAYILENLLDSYSKYVSSVDITVTMVYDELLQSGVPQEAVSKVNDEISYSLITTALDRNSFFSFQPIETIPSTTSFTYFTIAIFVLFVLYTGLLGANDLLIEKQSGCLDRISTTSISISTFIGSKIIVLSGFMFLQSMILFIPAYFFMGNLNFSNLWEPAVFIIICIGFSVSMALFFAGVFSTEQRATIVGNISILLWALIGGSFIPLQLMPPALQKLAQISPNYWMIKGLLFLSSGYGIEKILGSVGVLLIVGAGITILSKMCFRKFSG